MNDAWQSFLQEHGARIESGLVADFGDAGSERHAARGQSIVADLSHLAILEFSGEDAASFLHGQLTCDVNAIAPGSAAFGGYCTPKGRLLASFLLVRHARGYLMLHSRTITAALHKRLGMFVLRSKVAIREVSGEWVLLGLSGPEAPKQLVALHGQGRGLQADGSVAVEIPSRRIVLILPLAVAQNTWNRLRSSLRPVGTGCWQWLDIREGIPLVTAATQDQLVPQMANLELIGAVSFAKGCYPGQEVVARSQYLGKGVKRRLYFASLADSARPAAGDELFSDDLGAQASGLVVNAQAAPEGGYDLLVATPTASKENSVVRWKSPDGPALRFGALPYPVE
ncbi:MAG: hypothetical protein A3I01_13010 [Betaproteobacteria bacterium RIFCSPLOWO2_02_FULL_65_24]|nr:MAG: hypothetical protein A3I01_13010 [Betaproteobacteria bacterium RIFCSPLOWO2_02_FULL_65_24]